MTQEISDKFWQAGARTEETRQFIRDIRRITRRKCSAEEKGKFWLLKVNKDGTQLLPAADEWLGKGLYETRSLLFDKFGEKVGIIGIGIAGEGLMANAGNCVTGRDTFHRAWH